MGRFFNTPPLPAPTPSITSSDDIEIEFSDIDFRISEIVERLDDLNQSDKSSVMGIILALRKEIEKLKAQSEAVWVFNVHRDRNNYITEVIARQDKEIVN